VQSDLRKLQNLTLIGFAPAAAAAWSIASGSDAVKTPAVPSMRFCTSNSALRQRATSRFLFRSVDRISPKGFAEAFEVYELRCGRGDGDAEDCEFCRDWEVVYAALRHGPLTVAERELARNTGRTGSLATIAVIGPDLARDTQGRKKNRFPLPPKTLYGAARLCHQQSWIIHQYQRLGGCQGLWRAA
jgi:hypothetical protein